MPSKRSWTTARKSFAEALAAAAAALALLVWATPAPAALEVDPAALQRQMDAAYAKGERDGWHLADELNYFSTVLDAGRAYELKLHDDPHTVQLEATALALAEKLHYDPLDNDDAAEWYVRLAAQDGEKDPQTAAAATALLAKLDAEDASPATLAHDADADAVAVAQAFPGDVDALVGEVQADLRAFNLTDDVSWRTLALQRAAQASFPIANLPADLSKVLFPIVDAARNAAPGYTATEREAAVAIASHRAASHPLPLIGSTVSRDAYLVVTAPADEYFGHTKLSPIGVQNAIAKINRYLDVGWGARELPETLWVIDALDDWQHQYPRDYELPRLYKMVYATLEREDSGEAEKAAARVRRTLIVDYPASPEARSFLPGV